MRTLGFILFMLLLASACQRTEVKPTPALTNAPALIIDYPAGVIISADKEDSGTNGRRLTLASRLLAVHQIAVVDTLAEKLVFVKTNGDRITVTMHELAGKYDIILFNAVNNPVPLRLADLQGAFGKIFNIQTENSIPETIHVKAEKRHAASIDTSSKKTIRERFSVLNSRDKRVIVTTADTSAKNLATRIIPGIEWVQHRIDTRSILKVNFENDLITYANTDRYFTNGVAFEIQAAWLGKSGIMQKLMLPYRNAAFVTYKLSMKQDMYTPTDTRVAPTLHNDRPYSSYLYFSFSKTTADPIRKIKLTSQMDAGYIGPYSPGSYMQTLVHRAFPTNDEPLGWETQINTDIILNYSIEAQKALINNPNLSLIAGADIQAGTLYSRAGVSFAFQTGKYEPVFGIASNEKWPEIQYYFFAKAHTGFVGYNALLQGGAFNTDNIYSLKSNEIQRWVGSTETGVHFRYKGIGIELAQHYLSPEYKGGLWHKWGRISLIFKL